MRWSWLLAFVGLVGCSSGPDVAVAQDEREKASGGEIVTADIERFWEAYDVAARATTYEDTLRAFFERYYLPGSPGLHDFVRSRIGSVIQLVDEIERRPRYYASIRESTLRVREFVQQIREVLERFAELYPEMEAPDIYFLVGRLTSGGTTSEDRILIGTEMYGRTDETPEEELSPWLRDVLAPIDRLPAIVAHELIHTQQRYPQGAANTLLARAIVEGSCDFLGQMISGLSINEKTYEWADSREAELWADFREVMGGRDNAGWLYTSRSEDEPNDLGYWMGYQITQAYYERAEDKRQAIRDILHIEDFEAFLEASGYAEKFE